MAPSFPAPGLWQTYYIPTHTQPQSITFPLHVHMPTRYRDGYISSHACMQPYLCARRHEGCWRPRSLGDGGGIEGGASPWNTASQERSWASLRRGSDPSHQRERNGARLPELARGNSICHRSCPNRGTPKPDTDPQNCIISKLQGRQPRTQRLDGARL